jgi:hypothetical protein
MYLLWHEWIRNYGPLRSLYLLLIIQILTISLICSDTAVLEGSPNPPLPVSKPPTKDPRSTGSFGTTAWNLSKLDSPTRVPAPSSSSRQGGESETVSVSDVYVETRTFRSSLSVASSSTTSGVSSSQGHRVTRSPPVHDRNASGTPTWTEGTPSFTESSASDSGDLGNLESEV